MSIKFWWAKLDQFMDHIFPKFWPIYVLYFAHDFCWANFSHFMTNLWTIFGPIYVTYFAQILTIRIYTKNSTENKLVIKGDRWLYSFSKRGVVVGCLDNIDRRWVFNSPKIKYLSHSVIQCMLNSPHFVFYVSYIFSTHAESEARNFSFSH